MKTAASNAAQQDKQQTSIAAAVHLHLPVQQLHT
jgi:hypothetical protein